MYECRYCDKECMSTSSLLAHESVCPSNENRKMWERKWSLEKKLSFSKKCLDTKCNNSFWTDNRREEQRNHTVEFNQSYWTEEKRLLHSKIMIDVVKNNPNSYSKNNVSGRVKMHRVVSSDGPTDVKGKWELKVADWLNKNNVRWTNNIPPFSYFWNDSWHLYFPDFYISDFDTYIEVKGYETERDRCKWDAIPKPLIIIKEKEYKDLENVLNIFAGEYVSSTVGS